MRVAFEEFELDGQTRELLCRGKPLAVEPKVFDLLAFLIANRDRVVSKDELIENVWQGRIVSDAALDTCIKAARRAVGDDGKSQRIIRTMQRRGFRFVADVTERDPLVDTVRALPPSTLVGSARSPVPLLDEVSTLRLPDQPSIAVLPFENLTTEDQRSELANGLYRDITTRLGRARWLFVIARGSSSRFTSSQVQEAGAQLAVRYVVQGSLQSHAGKVRVNVALIDTIDRAEVWAEIFERAIDDIFAVQDEIANAIVMCVQSELELTERRRALLRPLASLSAWSAYHRGCWHLDRHTPGDYDDAERFFSHAARLDPGSARVMAGLSYVHRQRAFLELTRDRQGDVQRAYVLAQQSLALDPNDAQAHWVMGRALMLQNEVRPALAEFEMASTLKLSFAMGRYSVGLASAMLGESAPSDAALLAACRLSPFDPLRFAMIASQALNAAREGNYERATELVELAAGQPNAHYHIVAIAAMCNAFVGRRETSEHYLKRLQAVRPDYRAGQFFRAFPFQCPAHKALWSKGFELLRIPN